MNSPKAARSRAWLAQSLVEFQSVEKPELIALGEILEDGTFTLATQVAGKGKPGAVPGTHRVRLNADESIERYVSRKFLKHETSGITVKVPVEGELSDQGLEMSCQVFVLPA